MLDPLSSHEHEHDAEVNAPPAYSRGSSDLSKRFHVDEEVATGSFDPFVEQPSVASNARKGSKPLSNGSHDADDAEKVFEYKAVDRSAPMPITSLSRSRGSSHVTPPSSRAEAPATPTAAFPTPRQPAYAESEATTRASQTELICEACATGTLEDLKMALPATSQAVTMANTPHANSGLLPLHIAASRGDIQLCSYLLNECGAFVDADDPSGETALQKACLKGWSQVVQLLLTKGGKDIIESADNDGWTALMNAASKGFLDIVRVLVELGAQIDRQNATGYTALMCAASRGHAVVVRYLLANGAAPLLRNKAGETAYDAAVANFECHVADLLTAEELKVWNGNYANREYNPLGLHVNVAVVLHENQRLAGSRALLGTRPKFSSSALSRADKRTPFTLPAGGLNASEEHLSIFRSDVNLPTAEAPFVLPLPPSARRPIAERTRSSSSASREPLSAPAMSPSPSQTERSHFWLSDWAVDLTPPYCDPEEGWTYASSFEAPAEEWSAVSPAEHTDKAVRYRRWVRVLRRRLDRTSLPFADVDGEEELAYLDVGQPPDDADYLQRARWQAEGALRDVDVSTMPAGVLSRGYGRRLIARLEAAVQELKNGSATEEDFTRAQEAEALSTTYERRLHDLRDELGPEETEVPLTPRSSGRLPSSANGDYFGNLDAATSPSGTLDLTPHLMLSPSFRVPTRETPRTPLAAPSLPPPTRAAAWQPDEEATACVRCTKRFTIFLRKHHCRLCGRVVCANCSAHTDKIDATRLVPDPTAPSPFLIGPGSAETRHRTCNLCHEELTAIPAQLRSPAPSSPLPSIASDISELTECVVCGASLAPLGPKCEQEKHIQACLERGSGTVSNSNRFVAFRLPSTSPLVAQECEVCLEELAAGDAVARLACACFYHEKCARAWLLRGKGCPIHAVRESM